MPVSVAYLLLVAIVSTTPLAMKWSTVGVGFLFGVTGRMCIGAVLALLLCAVLRIGLPLHRRACLTYLVSGVGVFCAMSPAYWAVQYIPSGWIAVMFGMTPVFTSITGTLFLGEQSVSVGKTGALFICLSGLYLMFQKAAVPDSTVLISVGTVLAGSVCYAVSIVTIKAIGADIRATSTMTGTLVVTLILYLAVWYFGDGHVPASVPVKAAGAILYLGVIGSALRFMLFYYVLRHVKATQATLITLISPGCALILGHYLNHEPLTGAIVSGAVLVITGLVLFQYGEVIGWKLSPRRQGTSS